jgi:hypothetical protein
MKSTLLWALAVLNVALLALFIARITHENSARAQIVAARPAEYMLVGGETQTENSDIVYAMDLTNGVVGALTYDGTRNRLDAMNPIDLKRLMGPGNANAPAVPRGAPGAPGRP